MMAASSRVSVRVTLDVELARREGRPLVALESSVLAHGLPIPANAEAARRMCAAVELQAAVPAITAVVRGAPSMGLTPEELERFLLRDGVMKASARDLPVAMATGADAATTVAGALAICHASGVAVLATGGIGGVHREPAYDESADLLELARRPIVVVCSGAKSLLDLPATIERLETLGVTVVGFGTDDFPGFLFRSTGRQLSAVASDVDQIARILSQQRRLGLPGALLVVQPPPAEHALPRELVDAVTIQALTEARRAGVRGAEVTPFVLAAIDRATDGRSLRTNLALLESNARLAGEITHALVRSQVT